MMDQIAASYEADFTGTMNQFMGAMFPEGTDPELVEWVKTKAGAADPGAALGLFRDFPNLDLKASLAPPGSRCAASTPRSVRRWDRRPRSRRTASTVTSTPS